MLGQSVGKYRVVSRLGRGGMGTVYKAVDETLDREVAIKCLNADFGDADLLRRFRAEAITLGRLNHPNIATLYELTEHDGQLLMVMEYVRGETFDRVAQREGMMSVARAAQLCGQVLDALEHAHRAGVVHRDLKPANLMLTDSGLVKVMDFGLARMAGTEHLTSAGIMVGTPAYMAPEQILGGEIDGRADLYAMGVVLFRLLTAQLPFKADSGVAMVQSQLNEPPTPVRQLRSELPLACEAFLQRALAKSPGDRVQSTAEFRAALSQLDRLPGSGLAPAARSSIADIDLTLPPTPTPLHSALAGLPADTVVGPMPVPPSSPAGPAPASDGTVMAPMSTRPAAPADIPPPAPPAAVSFTRQPNLPPPAAATAPPTSRVPMAAVAAGIVLLLAIVGGAVFRSGHRTPAPEIAAPVTQTSPAAAVPAAPVTTAAPSTAPASAPGSAPAPSISPTTPAAPPAAATRPPAASAATKAKPSAMQRAAAVKPDPAPAPPAAAPVAAAPEPTPKPAEPEPKPPTSFAPVTLEDVTWWEIDGVKTHEREISLVLGPERIAMMEDEDTKATVPYHDVIGIYTSRSREPRYVEGGETKLVIAVGRGVFGLFKVGTPTWLTLRTARGFYPMQLSGGDRERLINEIEARTGAKLQVAK